MDADLIQDFIEDVNELIADLEEALLLLDKDRTNTDLIARVFRSMHSLKGASAMFGFTIIGEFTHAIEDIYDKIRGGEIFIDDKLFNLTLKATDHIKLLLEDPQLNDEELAENHQVLLKEMQEILIPDEEEIEEKEFNKEVFFTEAEELIDELESILTSEVIENYPESAVQDLFRHFHTLKGSSGMFGYKGIEDITHSLENIYDIVRTGDNIVNNELKELTLKALAHLSKMIEDPELEKIENQNMQKSLCQILNHYYKNINREEKPKTENTENNETEKASYYIYFNCEENKNPDLSPNNVLEALFSIGECEFFNASRYSWHIIIYADTSVNKLEDEFIFFKEQSEINIFKVTSKNLLQEDNFLKAFEKLAEENKSLELKSFETLNDIQKVDNKPIEQQNPVVKKEKKRSVQDKVQQVTKKISSIRVTSDKIDELMNLVSELVTTQAELSLIAEESTNSKTISVAEKVEKISRRLRDTAFSISLVPLEKSLTRFQRLVRDVSAKLSKNVVFKTEGAETELDKTVIEKIIDPIMHILRNSIDHGIDNPENRFQQGKPEHGTICLKAYYSGANVIIEISDDGRGIDAEKIKEKAISKGLISPETELSENEIYDLLFLPGFSTASSVSDVSGRGVGMDVVKRQIEEVRGTVKLESEVGQGTTVIISLPLTMSIIDSMLVRIAQTYYLIPLTSIDYCDEITNQALTESNSSRLMIDDNDPLPYIYLRKEFSIQAPPKEKHRIVIINYEDIKVGLLVDEIIGEHQAVLKSLGEVYADYDMISGASILGNGEIALVLDVNKLIKKHSLKKFQHNNTNNSK